MDSSENIYLERGFNTTPVQNHTISSQILRSCCQKPSMSYVNNEVCGVNEAFSFNQSIAEVKFKNDRKEYFIVCNDLKLTVGDLVSVEASPGHDVGVITLLGFLAAKQVKVKKISLNKEALKKIFRKAKTSDIAKWISVIEIEKNVLLKAKQIIREFKLNMKLNDVEYQADGTKAYFYYTAEDRVDFRELIKGFAKEFRIRIEMKQIGARQESAHLGGIGPCGRELCCSSWINQFSSVSTNAARTQQLLLNPQKLAGQCSKLKCCLNYEYPVYAEAVKKFPDQSIVLKTEKGEAVHQKSDIFKALMWYSYKNDRVNLWALSIESVKSIIAMNQKGKLPAGLEEYAKMAVGNTDSDEVVDQNEIRRMESND
jgi:cell fate regulator YaaT (PSP1 superfamily)